jgi:hypothetical protein
VLRVHPRGEGGWPCEWPQRAPVVRPWSALAFMAGCLAAAPALCSAVLRRCVASPSPPAHVRGATRGLSLVLTRIPAASPRGRLFLRVSVRFESMFSLVISSGRAGQCWSVLGAAGECGAGRACRGGAPGRAFGGSMLCAAWPVCRGAAPAERRVIGERCVGGGAAPGALYRGEMGEIRDL